LIIDDDPAARAAMGAALAQEYSLTIAHKLSAPTRLLTHAKPDLVILAMRKRQDSDLALLTELRTVTDTPVLVTSTHGTKAVVLAALRARANDYLDKPFTAPELLERVRSVLAQGPRPSHVAHRIRQFIHEHYMNDWTVGSLAAELQLSIRTLRQMFRRASRQSVMDCLREVRMSHACEFLTMTDVPIRAVAERVGFRDANYFARVFRHRVGCTPHEYRSAQRYTPPPHPSPRR
jgi:two-component system response regulator YesN